jgi:thiol-disulfide isomerase/thioredoxin
MKKLMGCAALAAMLCGTAGAYDSLDALVKDFQTKQNEAVKTYLEANPKAADADEARSRLIFGYRMTGQDELALPLMKQDYAALAAKGKEAEMREVFGSVQGMVSAYMKAGDRESARTFLAQVAKDFADSADAERFGQALKGLEKSLSKPVKGEVMALKFKDLDGKDVDLAALKDKVVLVDFWATWCGPCKAELPNVKAAFEKFHDKGFEIIGISMDEDRDKLDAFLKDNKITWPQNFDGKGWMNEIGQTFGINSIPATFLIGKDGKVAATDVRGEALGIKVAELIAK